MMAKSETVLHHLLHWTGMLIEDKPMQKISLEMPSKTYF